MSTTTCTHRSATGLVPGFLDEASRPTRSPACGHLELFATHPSG